MLNKELLKYIKNNIFPLYDGVDAGHNVEFHIKRVIKECLELANKIKGVNKNIIYTVAAYHDLGLLEDRERHHKISKKIVLSDKNLVKWFTKLQIIIIAEAVEDHRASNSTTPRSIYGKIVADSDHSVDLEEMLVMTHQALKQRHPDLDMKDNEKVFETAYEWILAKNSKNGYLKYYIDKKKELQHKLMQEQILDKEYIKKAYFKINNLK